MRSKLDRKTREREENTAAPSRTREQVEQIIVLERLHLYNNGLPCGAAALRRHLREHDGVQPLPSVHQIGKVLTRYGLTHGRTGWYEGEEPDGRPLFERIPRAERRCDILAQRAAS